jgi:hypothetical protein
MEEKVIRKTIARALVCGAFLSAHLLSASTLDFSFSADIQMGIGAGTGFSGTGSYDNSQATGVGVEYVPLASFDLTAFSETITLANVFEDGDAILDNGVLTSFKLGASTSPYFEFLFDEPSFYLGPADAGVFYDALGFNLMERWRPTSEAARTRSLRPCRNQPGWDYWDWPAGRWRDSFSGQGGNKAAPAAHG